METNNKNIDLNSEATYYIVMEHGNFGTYPREENAKGRTREEVYEDLKDSLWISGKWDIRGPYVRDEDYHKYKEAQRKVQRTSSVFWST